MSATAGQPVTVPIVGMVGRIADACQHLWKRACSAVLGLMTRS